MGNNFSAHSLPKIKRKNINDRKMKIVRTNNGIIKFFFLLKEVSEFVKWGSMHLTQILVGTTLNKFELRIVRLW